MKTVFSHPKRRTVPTILIASLILVSLYQPLLAAKAGSAAQRYVGSGVCKTCHPRQYESFTKYSRKARSFDAIDKMRGGLTTEEISGCYRCHTTGYGKPGGFVSPETTPEMKNAGCEVCHGPGGLHAATGNRKHIKSNLVQEDCEDCHTPERVAAFQYKPLVHGYAH